MNEYYNLKNFITYICSYWRKSSVSYSGTLFYKLNLLYNSGKDGHALVCSGKKTMVMFVTQFRVLKQTNMEKYDKHFFVNQIVQNESVHEWGTTVYLYVSIICSINILKLKEMRT